MKLTPITAFSILALHALSPVGLNAVAQPGSGIRLGPETTLTPQAGGSLNYDDNVNIRRRSLSQPGETPSVSDSDTFLRGDISLTLRHNAPQLRLLGRTWASTRQYNDNSSLDGDIYGFATEGLWLSPDETSSLSGRASIQRAEDNILSANPDDDSVIENASERLERDETQASINFTTELVHQFISTVGYSINDIAYTDERFTDRTSHSFIGDLGYHLSEKTIPFVSLSLSLEEDDSLDGYGERTSASIGVRYRATDKLNITARVGYEAYERTPFEFVPNQQLQIMEKVPGEEEKDTGLTYALNLTYQANDKTVLLVSARNSFVPSAGNSPRDETVFTASLRHQTTEQLRQQLFLSLRRDDYLDPLVHEGEEIDELKESVLVRYRIDYQTVRPWLSVFGSVSLEDESSKLPGEGFTQTLASIGASITY